MKDKHDKIEALEMRSASEISNQKEEMLLSTTIYESGLTVDADATEAEEWDRLVCHVSE